MKLELSEYVHRFQNQERLIFAVGCLTICNDSKARAPFFGLLFQGNSEKPCNMNIGISSKRDSEDHPVRQQPKITLP